MINDDSDSSHISLLNPEHPRSESHLLSKKSTIRGYDPYQSPPDIQLAMFHSQAKRIYRLSSHEQHDQFCPCCGLPEEGELIPITAGLKELYHLGSGYALYFELMKHCIALLILILLTSGVYNIISSAAEEDCTSNSDASDSMTCVRDFILIFSLANKKDSPRLMNAQMVLNLISMIVMILYFLFIHWSLRKTETEADDQTITPSDYTVKVSGLDTKITDEEIKEWIESVQTPDNKIKCRKINRTYDIRRYIELKKDKDALETQSRRVMNPIQQQLIMMRKFQLDSELNELKVNGLSKTHTALISFKRAEQAHFVLNQYKETAVKTWLDYLKEFVGIYYQDFKGKRVLVERAPEPTDILWENLAYYPLQKLKRRITTKVIAVVLIVFCFFLITLINWAQASLPQDYSFFIEVFSGVGSLLIIGINTLLGIAVRYLVEQEKRVSYTDYFKAVAEKLAIAQFINTAFTTLLAKIVLHNTFGKHHTFEGGFDTINFYGKGGLIENMFYVFISNAFVTPILAFFDPLYLWKLYDRKQVLKQGEDTKMTQQQAHQIFEQPEMDLALKNSLLVKTMLLTAFFAPAVPFALIFAILGLILNYWVDKYLLLRRNIYPISIQHTLGKSMLNYLEWMGIMFGLGNFFFIVTLRDSIGEHINYMVPQGVVYATIGLGGLLALLPMRYISKRLFSFNSKHDDPFTYDAARGLFSTDYDIQNPVTSRSGIHDYIKLIKEKKVFASKISKDLRKGAFMMLCHKKFMGLLHRKRSPSKPEERQNFSFLDEYVKNIERHPTLSQRKFNHQPTTDFNQIRLMGEDSTLEKDLIEIAEEEAVL